MSDRDAMTSLMLKNAGEALQAVLGSLGMS
jgi:hypothetical protein